MKKGKEERKNTSYITNVPKTHKGENYRNINEEPEKREIRITTGIAKNKKLKIPEIEDFRAVQEIAKSSVFSIIGEKVVNSTCLDLFAGSGNMGLEALSRGAKWCDFVDENPISVKTIKENIINCGFLEKSEVFRKKATKYITKTDKKYDLIFIDPFYKDISQKYLVSNLKNILNKDGIIVFFHGENLNIKDLVQGTNLKILEERSFGKSFFTLMQ
jgi:16S rRNA (guanine(966)-N(2))-methyltransferase RsmD